MVSRSKSRTKFCNVDILSFMGDVVQKHTKHYQSDFEIDKEILREAADRNSAIRPIYGYAGQQERGFYLKEMCF